MADEEQGRRWWTLGAATAATFALYLIATVLLRDSVRTPLYDAIGGPRGCGDNGLSSIPALLATYLAAAVAFTAWSRLRSEQDLSATLALTLFVATMIVAGLGTLLVVALSTGIGCIA